MTIKDVSFISLRFYACSERKQAKSILKKHRKLPHLYLKKKEKERKRTLTHQFS